MQFGRQSHGFARARMIGFPRIATLATLIRNGRFTSIRAVQVLAAYVRLIEGDDWRPFFASGFVGCRFILS